jgi:hypothetical protein
MQKMWLMPLLENGWHTFDPGVHALCGRMASVIRHRLVQPAGFVDVAGADAAGAGADMGQHAVAAVRVSTYAKIAQ